MLDSLIRKFFFALDPETAHGLAMNGIDFVHRAGIAGLLAKIDAGASLVQLYSGLIYRGPGLIANAAAAIAKAGKAPILI